MTSNEVLKGIDPPAWSSTDPVQPMSLPSSIVPSSDITEASELTDNQLQDLITPKVSNNYSSKTLKKKKSYELRRSPFLQQAIDRIESRRSDSTRSPNRLRNQPDELKTSSDLQKAMWERIEERCRTGNIATKKAIIKSNEESELGTVLELFSRYDSILDHLIRKNKKLRDYVKGTLDKYDPAELSLTSNDVLETLVDLKRRSKSWQRESEHDSHTLLSPPSIDRTTQKHKDIYAIPSLFQSSSESSKYLFDQGISSSSDARSRIKDYARKGYQMPRLREASSAENRDEIVHEETPLSYGYKTGTMMVDPPAEKMSTLGRIDPMGSKDPFFGKHGETVDDSSRPHLRDGHDSVSSLVRSWDPEKVVDLTQPASEIVQGLKIHSHNTAGSKKRSISAPPIRDSASRNKFGGPQERLEEMAMKAVPSPSKGRRSSTLGKLLPESRKHKSLIVHRKADAISRNALKLSEARQRLAAEKRHESLSPRQRGERRSRSTILSSFDDSTYADDNRVPPDTTTTQPGHFLPVSSSSRSSGPHLIDVTDHRLTHEIQSDYSVAMTSSYPSAAPSAEARRLQSEIDKVYAYSQEVRDSQDRLQSDMLRLKRRYIEGDKYRKMIVHSYKYQNQDNCDSSDHENYDSDDNDRDEMNDDIHPANTFEDLVRISSAEGSFGVFEADDGMIHIDEQSLKSSTLPPDMYRKNDTPYHVEDDVIVIDDYSLSSSLSKEKRPIHKDLMICAGQEGQNHDHERSNSGRSEMVVRPNRVKEILQKHRKAAGSPSNGNNIHAEDHRNSTCTTRNEAGDTAELLAKTIVDSLPEGIESKDGHHDHHEHHHIDSRLFNPDENSYMSSANGVEQLRRLRENLLSKESTTTASSKTRSPKRKVEIQIEPQSFDDYDDEGNYKGLSSKQQQEQPEPQSTFEEHTDDDDYYGDESDTNSLEVVSRGQAARGGRRIQVPSLPMGDSGKGLIEKEWEIGSKAVIKFGDQCGVLPCGLAAV